MPADLRTALKHKTNFANILFAKNFADQLPLLDEILKRIQASSGSLTTTTQNALLPVITGCHAQVKLLDELLAKTLPAPSDSSRRRQWKAVISVSQDKKFRQISSTLDTYIQILTLHQVTDSSDILDRSLKEPCFMVPFDRDANFVGRQEILHEIDIRFVDQRRVALAGMGGVG